MGNNLQNRSRALALSIAIMACIAVTGCKSGETANNNNNLQQETQSNLSPGATTVVISQNGEGYSGGRMAHSFFGPEVLNPGETAVFQCAYYMGTTIYPNEDKQFSMTAADPRIVIHEVSGNYFALSVPEDYIDEYFIVSVRDESGITSQGRIYVEQANLSGVIDEHNRSNVLRNQVDQSAVSCTVTVETDEIQLHNCRNQVTNEPPLRYRKVDQVWELVAP